MKNYPPCDIIVKIIWFTVVKFVIIFDFLLLGYLRKTPVINVFFRHSRSIERNVLCNELYFF